MIEFDPNEYDFVGKTYTVVEGYVDVDAGLMMVGDPCYTLPDRDGDPGYGNHARDELGPDWSKFCDRLWEEEEEVLKAKGLNQYGVPHFLINDDGTIAKDSDGLPMVNPNEMAERRAIEIEKPKVYHPWKKHPGAGMVVQTGYGDGTYPVEVEYIEFDHPAHGKEKRVKSVKVIFIGDDEDE